MLKNHISTNINIYSYRIGIELTLPTTLGQAGPSHRLPDITLLNMMTFIALALQMGDELKDTLHYYWSRFRHLHTPFYGKTMTQDRFLYMLHFLHFADNAQKPDEGKEYDQLWKVRTVFDTLNEAYAKYYNPLEHLAVVKVIVKFKGRVIFRLHSKEKKPFWHKNLQTIINQGIHMT